MQSPESRATSVVYHTSLSLSFSRLISLALSVSPSSLFVFQLSLLSLSFSISLFLFLHVSELFFLALARSGILSFLFILMPEHREPTSPGTRGSFSTRTYTYVHIYNLTFNTWLACCLSLSISHLVLLVLCFVLSNNYAEIVIHYIILLEYC